MLEPGRYSFDQDGLVVSSSLKYKFYCQLVDSGMGKGFPMAALRDRIDLLSFKLGMRRDFVMSTDSTCFESVSGYAFEADGNTLKMHGGSLEAGRVFRFLVVYMGRVYEQETSVVVEKVAFVPGVT